MLRIAEVTFTNSEGRSITIGNRGMYLLTERLTTSGLSSTPFTTKAFNQHGRTFVESAYDEQSFTFNFLINNIGLSNYSIQSARREIADVFLPHIGEGTLSVTLETGDIFLRSVSVDVAPYFPSGFENSNIIWQHVEVELVANNPYWYSSNQITETFETVEPLFYFPFTMSATDDPIIEPEPEPETVVRPYTVDVEPTQSVFGISLIPYSGVTSYANLKSPWATKVVGYPYATLVMLSFTVEVADPYVQLKVGMQNTATGTLTNSTLNPTIPQLEAWETEYNTYALRRQ